LLVGHFRKKSDACFISDVVLPGVRPSSQIAGFYQKHDPDAQHHASHEADQESEKELSSHRSDHGEPDAPLLIIEGGAGAIRRVSLPEKGGSRYG
jgi:hypothetical protein